MKFLISLMLCFFSVNCFSSEIIVFVSHDKCYELNKDNITVVEVPCKEGVDRLREYYESFEESLDRNK